MALSYYSDMVTMSNSSGKVPVPPLTESNRCGRCHRHLASEETGVCMGCFDPKEVSLHEAVHPTRALPGSERKIQIMRRRHELGLPLHLIGDRVYVVEIEADVALNVFGQ